MQIFLYFASSMRSKSFIKHGISLLLLLIFFQQMGAGLFIHNLVHDKSEATKTSSKQNGNSNEINFACSCVDDFLMPYTGADEIKDLQKPVVHTEHVTAYTDRFYFTTLIFSSLRGPPSLIG